MLPYQPYNPMFNPNIPNPNYPSQPQPQQSPLQSYQQRPPIIPGRVVTDINEVTPNEIPMDGRVKTQQIMQNDNANYRALHDELVQSQMDAKDAKIAEQAAASQAAQNQYLVQQLRPAAVPAFTVPNPYANYGYGCYSNANGCCNG